MLTYTGLQGEGYHLMTRRQIMKVCSLYSETASRNFMIFFWVIVECYTYRPGAIALYKRQAMICGFGLSYLCIVYIWRILSCQSRPGYGCVNIF